MISRKLQGHLEIGEFLFLCWKSKILCKILKSSRKAAILKKQLTHAHSVCLDVSCRFALLTHRSELTKKAWGNIIHHLHSSHIAPYLPPSPQFCITLIFSFLLCITGIPFKKQCLCKIWGGNKLHNGKCASSKYRHKTTTKLYINLPDHSLLVS